MFISVSGHFKTISFKFCDPAMGPLKRPAPDALEETELFRKVLAAFLGIEVVADAISHGGLGS